MHEQNRLSCRRWAQLSSRLTSQLADQADVTAAVLRKKSKQELLQCSVSILLGSPVVKAGIAYLTRDWAEMARRSHAALDQA